MQQAPHLIDPTQLARIKDLELLARTVVEGYMAGLHRSPRSGISIEFSQYRPYSQGDDLRFVDWKLYGRTDRLYVKEFQDETNLRCSLLLDCSGSMEYTSGEVSKFHYARMLVACLATILSQQKDEFGFAAYDEKLGTHLPQRSDRLHLRRVLVELENLVPANTTDTAGTLRFVGDIIPPRGMVVLVSDLLHPIEGMIDHLRSLRARRHDVIVFQISDTAEQTFPFDRSATFIDAESSNERFAIPDLIRDQYLKNRRKHFDSIRRECLAAEIDLQEFSTDEPLDRALTYFIRHRARGLQTSSHSSRRGRGGR